MKQHLLILLALCMAYCAHSQAPLFIDGSEEAGISGTSSNYCAAIVDFDQDGLEDIYVGSKLSQPNKAYRNNGDGTFTNMASQLGLESGRTTQAVIWADFDNDGDPDCYLGNYNQDNQYYRNDGDGVFVEIAEELGISGDFGNTGCVVSA
ncbi:MAG: VCBS repeat-containing protein, partial [Flavobacteriales bacterium]|nr:VCBS repeat-containing protein [Flavobacteriales bacterium]